jgi:uncharacterized protein (DUF433 family)
MNKPAQPTNYVNTDQHGVLRVGETHVMLDSVIAAFLQGHSAETIQQQYASLSLEQVYGSIAYYLAHRSEVEACLRRQETVWDDWRGKAEQLAAPVIQRLRALREARPVYCARS